MATTATILDCADLSETHQARAKVNAICGPNCGGEGIKIAEGSSPGWSRVAFKTVTHGNPASPVVDGYGASFQRDNNEDGPVTLILETDGDTAIFGGLLPFQV